MSKVALKQFIEAKCEPRRQMGPFKKDAYKPANTHDGALDKLSKKHPSLRHALSEIAGSFWVWNPAARFSLVKSAKLARALICLRDETNGADNTCFTGKKTTGQLDLIKAVAASNNPSKLRYMEAFFTITGDKKLELFEKRELQVARGDKALRDELVALAGMTDPVNVENIVKGEEGKAPSMANRGVSASAAAQLAGAAFNMVDHLVNTKGQDCNSQVVKDLYKKGVLWRKIARRLAHGGDAVRFQNSMTTKDKLEDPLVMERGGLSAVMCMADKAPYAATKATRYLNVQGSFGEISAASLTFLVGAMAAADAVMAKCGKPVARRQVRTQEKCKGGKVPDGNLGCECPPNKPRWSSRKKRCYKPTVYRPMRPTPMRPTPMRPVAMRPASKRCKPWDVACLKSLGK